MCAVKGDDTSRQRRALLGIGITELLKFALEQKPQLRAEAASFRNQPLIESSGGAAEVFQDLASDEGCRIAAKNVWDRFGR